MVICTKEFLQKLYNFDISFFAGVPDSLLKDICACITTCVPSKRHVICANEGGAVALGMGYHLATGKIPLIYFQNSGLGNSINPLLSLVDKQIYAIPMLLMIGWRGEPNLRDEPQHIKQGSVMLSMLKAMDIPYSILKQNACQVSGILENAISYMKKQNHPYALLVRKDTFEKCPLRIEDRHFFELSREDALKQIISVLNAKDVLVCTNGKASREVFDHRAERKESHERDFLVIGGMGHASKVALGIALEVKKRQVFCIDGDGAALMHLGSLAIAGSSNCRNFKHILINNGAHESVGGQPTLGFEINFREIALAVGYKHAFCATNTETLIDFLEEIKKSDGPSFLEVRVRKKTRADLARPKLSPLERKTTFMKFLQET